MPHLIPQNRNRRAPSGSSPSPSCQPDEKIKSITRPTIMCLLFKYLPYPDPVVFPHKDQAARQARHAILPTRDGRPPGLTSSQTTHPDPTWVPPSRPIHLSRP